MRPNTRATTTAAAKSCSETHAVSWFRLLVVVATFATMVVTNPDNNLGSWIPDKYWHISAKESGFWSSLIPPQDTNYGLFSLSKTIDGISANGLLHSAELCHFDSDDELLNLVCGWIDDTFCHSKPLLDKNDLPFTINRLLCWMLLLIMICPLFITRIRAETRQNNATVNAICAVIGQPTVWDLTQMNLIVYPTLVSMDRLLRSYLVIDGYTWRFLVAFVLLFFVIGAICNQIGSVFQQRERVMGMAASFAACLGYYRAVGMVSKGLFQFVEYPFSALTIFWMNAAMLFMQNRPGNFLAWVAGGFMGHLFGEIHQQLLAEALRSNAKSALSRTIRQILNFF
jgi:hypothetical protein